MKMSAIVITCFLLAGLGGGVWAQEPDPIPVPEYARPTPPSPSRYGYQARIRIEKGMNEEGYQLRIYTSEDVDPESIQVSIQGRSILIENARSMQREESNDRGFYSFSRSASTFRRRFSIPRNADADQMHRSVENGVITITLPYLNGYRR